MLGKLHKLGNLRKLPTLGKLRKLGKRTTATITSTTAGSVIVGRGVSVIVGRGTVPCVSRVDTMDTVDTVVTMGQWPNHTLSVHSVNGSTLVCSSVLRPRLRRWPMRS
jgi:hypothetical protein